VSFELLLSQPFSEVAWKIDRGLNFGWVSIKFECIYKHFRLF